MLNDWTELGAKINTALAQSTAELEQIAVIYNRLGKRKQAKEIENPIQRLQTISVPEVSII